MNLAINWRPVVKAFEDRLSIWKAKTLSIGGRLTLLKSISKTGCRFGKQESGGLGIGSLKAANLGLLSKWWWRIRNDDQSIWGKVIKAIHKTPRIWGPVPRKASLSGVWNTIAKVDLSTYNMVIHNCIKGVIGNGCRIRFWVDVWVANTPLMMKFPHLFMIVANKEGLVNDFYKMVNDSSLIWEWSWRRLPESATEIGELHDLHQLLLSVTITQEEDKWIWTEEKGVFTVCSVREKIDSGQVTDHIGIYSWNNWISKKVNVFCWKANMETIPTLVALARRNLQVNTDFCPLCSMAQESTEHILISCPVSNSIWQYIVTWCKLPPFFAFSIKDLMEYHRFVNRSDIEKKLIQAIFYITIWSIWKARNKKVFDNILTPPTKIVEGIKTISYLWINSKSKKLSLEWNK